MKDAGDLEDGAGGGSGGAVVRFRCQSLTHLMRMTKFSKKEMRMLYQGFKQVRRLTANPQAHLCPHALVASECEREAATAAVDKHAGAAVAVADARRQQGKGVERMVITCK